MSLPIIIPILIAMFLAINMGASGISPAFSVAFGANVLKKSLIPGLFGLMVVLGAIIAGDKVSLTIGKDILSPELFTVEITSVVLLSTALSIFFANIVGIPQSTSQSTVLSIAGAALAMDSLNLDRIIYEIIPAWFVLPFVAFIIMLVLNRLIKGFNNRSHLKDNVFIRIMHNRKIANALVVLSSCYVAFSIGANNVANAAGPIASLCLNETGDLDLVNASPIILLSMLLIAPCFGIGSSLLGDKVLQKTGKGIVDISNANAVVVSFLVASLLLAASIFKGIPTSLVQLNFGALLALKISKNGFNDALQNKIVKQSFIIWMIAPIFAFTLSYLIIKLTL